MTRRIIAIASGKGGTGKTTVAVSLAVSLAEKGRTVQYVDSDVEEPNGHLFLHPERGSAEDVDLPTPVVDTTRCTACGRCADACAYHAIAVLKSALIFPELCHGCGGCFRVCPEGAIREKARTIGVVETGRAGAVAFAQGRLCVGEPMAPPVIRAVQRRFIPEGVILLDAPPGTSCPVVAAVRDADAVILVTEPTPFGLHDLRLAVELLRRMNRPFGIVINRAEAGRDNVATYARAESIEIWAELPDDRQVAETYARGGWAVTVPSFRSALAPLVERVARIADAGVPA